jgi:hypothetical protein
MRRTTKHINNDFQNNAMMLVHILLIADQVRTNSFEDVAAGDDGPSVIVSTLGDPISAKLVTLG